MSFVEPRAMRPLLALLLLLSGCGGLGDDLFPSGADRRPAVVPGTIGPAVGQVAPDFTLSDLAGAPVSLYATLASKRGVVLYFTMWCPICDAHMSDLRANALPTYPDIPVFVIDYVSGSVAGARSAQAASGWDVPGFTYLADVGASVEGFYRSPMAMVVIDRDHVVRMNGEYTWPRLQAVLGALP
jgi:peroxiredoxin